MIILFLKKNKKLIIFLLSPIIISSVIGIFIGLITRGRFPQYNIFENITIWVMNLAPGVIAHEIAWLAGYYIFKWKMTPTIRGTWKQNSLGLLLTFVFILIISSDDMKAAEDVLLLFFQVTAICILIYAFLFQFKFYHRVEALFFNKEKIQNENMESNIVDSDYLKLEDSEKIEKINTNTISHITVEDHYCTIVYYKDNQWQKWMIYEKLSNFEKKYPSNLLRINRSTLVNPKMVRKIEKVEGKHLLTMKANHEVPFPLSSSRKHHLDKLVPIIS